MYGLLIKTQHILIPFTSIVAVHGLGGHHDQAWKHNNGTKDGVVWLKNLLPLDVPKARILAFGYSASAGVGISQRTPTITLRQYAEQLINHLMRERKKDHKVYNSVHVIDGF